MKRVVIFGAGGHARVVADTVRACGDEVAAFLDDDPGASDRSGNINDYGKFDGCEFVVAIGNTQVRERLSQLPVKWYTAVHPSAVISPSASVGEGTVVMPNAVVNARATIGRHCIINTCAVVEHDNVIDDYAHISVGARLGGLVHVGRSSWIGIGATVSNCVDICGGCMIGAGSVVIDALTVPGTYMGVPAKRRVK